MPQATRRWISEKVKSLNESNVLPFHDILDAKMVNVALASAGVTFRGSKGVTANSWRKLREMGNQPDDGISWAGRAESSMKHRPTARRITGTPPTRALRLGDPPYPYLLADCGRDLEALPRRMVRLGDGPSRLPGQEGSAVTTIIRDCSGSLTRGSSRVAG